LSVFIATLALLELLAKFHVFDVLAVLMDLVLINGVYLFKVKVQLLGQSLERYVHWEFPQNHGLSHLYEVLHAFNFQLIIDICCVFVKRSQDLLGSFGRVILEKL
jgi:hypothetical protein